VESINGATGSYLDCLLACLLVAVLVLVVVLDDDVGPWCADSHARRRRTLLSIPNPQILGVKAPKPPENLKIRPVYLGNRSSVAPLNFCLDFRCGPCVYRLR